MSAPISKEDLQVVEEVVDRVVQRETVDRARDEGRREGNRLPFDKVRFNQVERLPDGTTVERDPEVSVTVPTRVGPLTISGRLARILRMPPGKRGAK